MKLFYIENTVDEREYRINGYFSTLEKAQEALKDCCDWYREKGTGKIYQVDMDVLNPDPVLVCKDGEIDKNYAHRAEMDFFIFMKNAFGRLPETVDKQKISAAAFYDYVCENDGFEALKEFLDTHNITEFDDEFEECFFHVKKDESNRIKDGASFSIAELVTLMRNVFDDHPLEQINGMHLPYLFLNPDGSVIDTENTAALKEFMRKHNLSFQNELMLESFYYVRQDYFAAPLKFNLNALVIDDDGFKGEIIAYNPQANMYNVRHELVNGRLPVADGWYPPERLRLAVENTKSSVQLSNAEGIDSLIATARAISEQSKNLADNLDKFKGESGIDKE